MMYEYITKIPINSFLLRKIRDGEMEKWRDGEGGTAGSFALLCLILPDRAP